MRLLGEPSRAQSDLYQSQETVRKLNHLKDELGSAQRRVEELGQKLVAQEATNKQIHDLNEALTTKAESLLARNQELELGLATAKASSAAQEQVVQNMLLRLSATAPAPTSIKTKQLTLPERVMQHLEKIN